MKYIKYNNNKNIDIALAIGKNYIFKKADNVTLFLEIRFNPISRYNNKVTQNCLHVLTILEWDLYNLISNPIKIWLYLWSSKIKTNSSVFISIV